MARAFNKTESVLLTYQISQIEMKGLAMSGKDDKSKGKWDEAKGKAKQAWGDLTEDEEAQVSGEADEAKGKGRQKWGEAKEWVEDKTDDKK